MTSGARAVLMLLSYRRGWRPLAGVRLGPDAMRIIPPGDWRQYVDQAVDELRDAGLMELRGRGRARQIRLTPDGREEATCESAMLFDLLPAVWRPAEPAVRRRRRIWS